MAVNKVVYDDNTLIDLTSDTVTADTLAQGVTAHAADGSIITGVAPTTAVLYTAQTLTEDQKRQARENIGATKSSSESLSCPAASWTGSEAPFTATIPCSIATASNHLIVGHGGAMTADEQAAIAAAMIVCTAQAAGSITLSAFGEKPEIAIPVNVICIG